MSARRLLHPGAVEHYEDALNYEQRYASRVEDIDYYLKRARGAYEILEYGAGAGRLTIPLCNGGHHVVAVDASEPMIARLRGRLEALPRGCRKRVRPVVADMREYRQKKRFDLVIAAFHTVCHLYSLDDVRAFFSLAFAHLRPGGRLLFDLPLPRIDVPGYDPIAQVRVTEMESPAGPQLLTQRWFGPQELLMHLHYAGFERARLTSDFSSQPVSNETSVMCVTANRPQHKHSGRED